MIFLQNDDSLYIKIKNFLLIDIFVRYFLQKEISISLKTSYHFKIDILHMKEKVRAEGFSYIKFMEKKKNLFYLVHL